MQVNGRTKIVVLDDSDTRPIKLARALSDSGMQAYVLKVSSQMKGFGGVGMASFFAPSAAM